ncbi:MAG: hypothetical protein KGN84_19345 [Acidobacteriota bacterium]|nr:hypothetical protein [Acidobacteriota bacterium]
MSYDLHLRPPAKKYLPTAVVSERIVGLGNVDGDGVSFRYRNPVTGAACSFHIESDHVLAPLSLERPRFFGLETMLLVSRLAEALNFEIFDPQQDRKIEGEDLLDLWIARNEEAIRALKSELPFLDLEKSLY